MIPMDLVSLRRKAEEAVADMPEGPLKTKAFEVILGSLLAGRSPQQESQQSLSRPIPPAPSEAPASISARITLLADEAFYPQNNLSTPLVRLVRQRRLRRLQLAEGNKKVWKYSLP
jgi:hypothetical protein